MTKKGLYPVLSAVFAAFLAILSQASIPTPFGIPFTLQTFAISLYGFILGPLWATVTLAVYMALGIVGLPVFSGFGSGIGALLGPTGGFIWGFFALAFFCGISKNFKYVYIKILFCFIGILICHLCGIAQYALLYKVSFVTASITVSLPYILKDVLCIIAAFCLSPKIISALKKFGSDNL